MNSRTRLPCGPERCRLASLAQAAGSATLLIALLSGLPYVLRHYGGWLLSDRLPSLEDLWNTVQSPPSVPLLLEALVVAGWVTWAVLCLNTLLEGAWWLRQLPAVLRGTDVRLLAARRGLTGVLIATLVLGLLAAVRAEHVPALAPGTPTPAAYTLPAVTAPLTPGPDYGADVATSTQRQWRPLDSSTPQDSVCTVRHGDTLWDLARRHLDNPLRWQEIYRLNHGREQADGRRLTNPDRIYPGWQLALPAENLGTPEPTTSPLGRGGGAWPASPQPRTASAPSAPAPVTATPVIPAPIAPAPTGQVPQMSSPGHPDQHSQPTSGSAPHESVGRRRHGVELPGGVGYIDVATLAALGSAAALLARRRRRDSYRPTAPRPLRTPTPAGPEQNPLIHGIRRLAREWDEPLVGDEQMPRVSLGTAADGTLALADVLDRSPGAQFALTGPGADDAVRALLVSALTTAPTGRGEHLVLAAAEAERLVPALIGTQLLGVTIAETTDAALQYLEDHALDHARDGDIETTGDEDSGGVPRLVLVASGLDRRQQHRLDRILRGASRCLGAVHLGPTSDLADYEVASDGTTRNHDYCPDDAFLPRFFHLAQNSADILLRVIRAAHVAAPDRNCEEGYSGIRESSPEEHEDSHSIPEVARNSAPPPESDPAPVAIPVQISAGPVRAVTATTVVEPQPTNIVTPALESEAESAPPPTAGLHVRSRPLRLTLLGTAAMDVRGSAGRPLSGSVGELLAFLAVHDAGASTQLIATSLWPAHAATPERAQAKFDNTKAYARRLLRDALGASAAMLFVQNPVGWRLDPQLISSDLDDLRSALKVAHRAAAPQARLAACRHAADLDTGPLLGADDAEWLDIHREDLRRRLLDCLDTLASAPGQPPEETLRHLGHALSLDTCNEHLHLRQARLLASLGRSDAVLRTLEQLKQHLGEIDERPSPAVVVEFRRLLDPTIRPTPIRLTPEAVPRTRR